MRGTLMGDKQQIHIQYKNSGEVRRIPHLTREQGPVRERRDLSVRLGIIPPLNVTRRLLHACGGRHPTIQQLGRRGCHSTHRRGKYKCTKITLLSAPSLPAALGSCAASDCRSRRRWHAYAATTPRGCAAVAPTPACNVYFVALVLNL